MTDTTIKVAKTTSYMDNLDRLQQAVDLSQVEIASFDLTEGLHEYAVVVNMTIRSPGREARVVAFNNLPREASHMLRDSVFGAPDDVVKHCRTHATPLCWALPTPSVPPHAALGVSFPLHNAGMEWGILSLITVLPGTPANRADALAAGALFAPYVQQAIRRVVLGRTELCSSSILSQRERECLFWTLEGKTSWEIARILGVKERTVVFHVQNGMHKLGAKNRLHAAAQIVGGWMRDKNEGGAAPAPRARDTVAEQRNHLTTCQGAG